MRGRPRLSLKARAIRWLAQREHSRVELRQKLWRQAQADARAESLAASADGEDDAPDPSALHVQIETLLDGLEAENLLNDQRFAQSRVRTRAPRFGIERIRSELSRLGVTIDPQAVEAEGTETERAHRVWSRKYGPQPSSDRQERARQARFLASRGFSSDVIRRVVSGKGSVPTDD